MTTYKLSLSGEGLKIDKELDRETALQIVALAMGGSPPAAPSGRSGRTESPTTPQRKSRTRRRATTAEGEQPKPKRRRRSGGPGLVKDLTLRPGGKKAFKDFAEEKQPKTHQQKQAVIVYWLRHELGMESGITADHVNTCYLDAGWVRPANLDNNLQVTAAQKGWLDTSDMDNITIGTRGEDVVQHDLPAKSKTK